MGGWLSHPRTLYKVTLHVLIYDKKSKANEKVYDCGYNYYFCI